ncbi:hypothetical protein NXS98_09485 [Fontisphaera persica]|uniref:hypothetical protein n=1 Tax=Fontisphaera persica TaxID=2974023 RepID=UPI0024C060B0|nr:hypothetical protein [Fontisphaera persica]WCJ57960.1 hypothetical protein NXS98_09485 [Fontisphaera persica]
MVYDPEFPPATTQALSYPGGTVATIPAYDVCPVSTIQTAGAPRAPPVAEAGFLAAKGTANANRIAGVRAVDDFIAQAQANGMLVRGREVTFNTPFGARRMAVILENPQKGLIGGVEIKSSVGAFNRFDRAARQQFSADRWINTYGATSVGEQSGITINNTIKILWPAPAP